MAAAVFRADGVRRLAAGRCALFMAARARHTTRHTRQRVQYGSASTYIRDIKGTFTHARPIARILCASPATSTSQEQRARTRNTTKHERSVATGHLLFADTLPFEVWLMVSTHYFWVEGCMGWMHLSQLDILSLLALCCLVA